MCGQVTIKDAINQLYLKCNVRQGPDIQAYVGLVHCLFSGVGSDSAGQ